MKNAPPPPVPRPRTLIHPGRFNPVRIQSLRSPEARHVRLALLPGVSLFDGLVKPLAEIGITNRLDDDPRRLFRGLQYCVAPPDPSGQAVIAYSKPITAGRTYMVFGNATLGKSMKGCRSCIAMPRSAPKAATVKGGHILTDTCIVGRDPIPVLVTSLDDFELRQAYDPETNIPLLQPYKEPTNG